MSLYLREEFWYWLYYRFCFCILILLAVSLSYMALLESLVKSPVMNNRCLICAIVVALSPRSKDLVSLSIVMVFQPPFVLFIILLGYF
jgi:hypothetical protein